MKSLLKKVTKTPGANGQPALLDFVQTPYGKQVSADVRPLLPNPKQIADDLQGLFTPGIKTEVGA